jgi:predicted flap endonuclease-1-like 5' DNA nuclease
MLKKQYLKSSPVCKVTFSLPLEAAPDAKVVKVLGEFNDWSWENGTPMKRTKNDYTATLELATGKCYEFRYFIDEHAWENDWQADDYAATSYGVFNSVVVIDAPLSTPFTPEEITEKAEGAADEAVGASSEPKPKTKGKKSTKETVQDDLVKIEGIGPKIAGLLHERGIFTFADLAKAELGVLQNVLAQAGSRFRLADPGTWAEQAQLLADGDTAGFERLTKELKGGKR